MQEKNSNLSCGEVGIYIQWEIGSLSHIYKITKVA